MFWSKPKTTPELEQAISAYITTYVGNSPIMSRRAVRPFVFDIDFGTTIVRIGYHTDGSIIMFGWHGAGTEPGSALYRGNLVQPDKLSTFFGQFVAGRWTTISTAVTGWEWRTKKYQYPTRRKRDK